MADKVLEQVLRGTSDASIAFRDLRNLLLRLGFAERTKGGHHMFGKAGVRELINLQKDGKNAKPYQVRQVRAVIIQYKLAEVK
jgi:hypothetical protein